MRFGGGVFRRSLTQHTVNFIMHEPKFDTQSHPRTTTHHNRMMGIFKVKFLRDVLTLPSSNNTVSLELLRRISPNCSGLSLDGNSLPMENGFVMLPVTDEGFIFEMDTTTEQHIRKYSSLFGRVGES